MANQPNPDWKWSGNLFGDDEDDGSEITKGDKPGHKFRGNQYKDGEGEGGGENPKLAALRELGVRLGQHVNPDTKAFVKKMNLTDEETQKISRIISEGMKNATPVVMVTSFALESIMQDGRFKTQFETGDSGGVISPRIRSGAEKVLFDYPESSGTPPELRPVYGTVAFDDPCGSGTFDERSMERAEVYGSIRVVLNPDVSSRTTFSIGDTLSTEGKIPSTPALLGETDPAKLVAATSFPNPVDGASRVRDAVDKFDEFGFDVLPPKVLLSDIAPAYVETQIHGGLSVNDIAKVVIPADSSQKYIDKIKAMVEPAGIPVEFTKPPAPRPF